MNTHAMNAHLNILSEEHPSTCNTGSSFPLLNYWQGKYASDQEPNGNLNAFLNFYTHEDRHMFAVSGNIERTYHIYLPPGPIVAGYSVEANWVPPDKMPVTDPLVDFPTSANQDEPYLLKFVLNGGDPVLPPGCCCCGSDHDCSDLYYEIKQWNGVTVNWEKRGQDNPDGIGSGLSLCDTNPDHYGAIQSGYWASDPGWHRGFAVVFRVYWIGPDEFYDQYAYTVFNWYVQE
jgi:hypothetical protein